MIPSAPTPGMEKGPWLGFAHLARGPLSCAPVTIPRLDVEEAQCSPWTNVHMDDPTSAVITHPNSTTAMRLVHRATTGV